MVLIIGNARQATSEGKGGPVETGLTRPAATALPCFATLLTSTVLSACTEDLSQRLILVDLIVTVECASLLP